MLCSNILNNFIADNIEAIFNVWFVGDKMLTDSFPAYKEMLQQGRESKDVMIPYLFEFYNVKDFHGSASGDDQNGNDKCNYLARVINALTEAANKCDRLPRYVVITIDIDLIEAINVWEPEKVAIQAFNETSTWLVKHVNMVIRRRKVNITDKNPGAIFGADPKIIFLKAMRRASFYPKGSQLERLCMARTKFNDALNEAVAKYNNHIMNITACNLPEHYNRYGRLSNLGSKVFWQEMDHLMERFDKNEIQLLPAAANYYNKKHQVMHNMARETFH